MIVRAFRILVLSVGLGAVVLSACGGSTGTGSGASCSASADCGSGEVCVKAGADSACTLNCTASADACGGSASCEGVGQVGVNICQQKKPAPSASNPPDPKAEPKLPCASDAECGKLAHGTVCAEWHGDHDCTNRCTSDDECNPPPVGGFSVRFLGCQADEGDKTRTVCLPREECFTNPTSCVTFPGGLGTGGGFGGTGGFGF